MAAVLNPAAWTGTAVPETGAAAMSLPPWVVPTTAVSPAANTGVTVTVVAPYSGFWVEAVMLPVGPAVTVAVVEEDLPGSSTEVALMVTVPVLDGCGPGPGGRGSWSLRPGSRGPWRSR